MLPDAVPIKCKWVFKLKTNEKNEVVRYKARLTAYDYAQRHDRDYDETCAPVASAASFRFIFAIAAARCLYIDQHDIRTAFLYGILPANQRVYLRVSTGLDLPPDVVLFCLRGIYGLRQSPRLFNEYLFLPRNAQHRLHTVKIRPVSFLLTHRRAPVRRRDRRG